MFKELPRRKSKQIELLKKQNEQFVEQFGLFARQLQKLSEQVKRLKLENVELQIALERAKKSTEDKLDEEI